LKVKNQLLNYFSWLKIDVYLKCIALKCNKNIQIF